MIDVLLPFHGDPGYLRLAVRSILAQTHPDWRLVVVDDGYPDPTVRPWFAELGDERIEYHRNPRNLGANATYRRALELATAPHVIFMGADDLMLPGHLEGLSRSIDSVPDAGVYTCGVEVIDERGDAILPPLDRIKRWLTPRPAGRHAPDLLVVAGEAAVTRLMHGNWTYFPALCWNRTLVTAVGFRAEYDVVQDLALLVDVLGTGAPLVVAGGRRTFQYRRHAASDSSVKTHAGGARFAEEAAYYATMAAELSATGRTRAARAAHLRATHRAHLALAAAESGRRGDLKSTGLLLRQALGH